MGDLERPKDVGRVEFWSQVSGDDCTTQAEDDAAIMAQELAEWYRDRTAVLSEGCNRLDEHHCACVPDLRKRIAELEAENRGQAAVRSMTVGRLGGEVEGKPTHSGNFLQRIDELRGKEAELARLTEANRWIPVESGEMPEIGTEVLVCDVDGVQDTGFMATDGLHNNHRAMLDITHWRPLPEGPR